MKAGIIVVGAGGHAKVCIELLQEMGEEIAFCISNKNSSKKCLSIPVLEGNDNLRSLRKKGYFRVFIAIGSNNLRMILAKQALNLGYELVNAISSQAIVSPTAQLGLGIAIMAGVVINSGAKISDLAIINTGASIDHDCYIGKGTHIAPQSALAGNVRVGFQSFLGIGSVFIPTVTVGNNVIIGAGSVVISNIKDNVTAVGSPARIVKELV